MTEWTVKLADGSIHRFVDLRHACGQYYELQPNWIHKLQAHIKENSEYSVYLNLIEMTRGPKDERLQAPFLLLIITRTKLTVTFLGELTENETGYIAGVWPEQFLHILKEDNDAIINLLFIVTDQPQLMEKINIYF